MAHLCLIAASDDFLLQEAVEEQVAASCTALGGVNPEVLADGTTAEGVAFELRSPSLFAPQRVLVVNDASRWVDAPPPQGEPRREAEDPAPLVEVLDGGMADEMGLVLGVWCSAQPKGPLVDAVRTHGKVRWIPLPPAPKPWEDVTLSQEQESMLLGLLRRFAGSARFSDRAAELLLERLGFAPRLLAQEVQKLTTAAGGQGEVDEELVRRLTFPRDRSLEVVRDAVLARDRRPLFDLLSAADAGLTVRDWRGQRLDPSSLPLVLFGQVATLLEQLLYVRRVATQAGLARDMDPRATTAHYWYQRVFKTRLAGELQQRTANDPGSPLAKKGESEWRLSQLFQGAGRYNDEELIDALGEAGDVESRVRGAQALGAISVWLGRLMSRPGS